MLQLCSKPLFQWLQSETLFFFFFLAYQNIFSNISPLMFPSLMLTHCLVLASRDEQRLCCKRPGETLNAYRLFNFTLCKCNNWKCWVWRAYQTTEQGVWCEYVLRHRNTPINVPTYRPNGLSTSTHINFH